MTRKLLFVSLLLLMAVSLDAQGKKRALKPISFRVLNSEPTTVITNEPFRVTYRLEYLLPRDGKEVKILDNLDKNHFQAALGAPVDVDFQELKKKALKKITEEAFNALKLDSAPRITVSDFYAQEDVIVGDKVIKDFVVILKVVREKTTMMPILVIKLELPEVPVRWAVAQLGQKEGEYPNEDPVKSGKVRVNHALTTPTHDPNLNFRSTVVVPQYSSSSISWFFWGYPAIAAVFVLTLVLNVVRMLKQPVYVAEEKVVDVTGQQVTGMGDAFGVKRLKFKYARGQLWRSVNAIISGAGLEDQEGRKNLASGFYENLYDLLLSAVPSASVGSLPKDFVKTLTSNERGSVLNDTLIRLAASAESLRPSYEAIGEKDISDDEFRGIHDEALVVRNSAKRLWSRNRIIPSLKRLFRKSS